MGRKVAILGKAATVAFAPFNDPSWEIWSMPWMDAARVDRHFDVHTQRCWDESPDGPSGWEDGIGDTPVYCDPSRAHLFKNPVEYPLADVLKSLPIPFLECTISYELALAIHEGVEAIGLWGVHMMARVEYAFQRPSVTYLAGLAQGRGIELVLPEGSTLFQSNHKSGRYGVADDPVFRLRKVA